MRFGVLHLVKRLREIEVFQKFVVKFLHIVQRSYVKPVLVAEAHLAVFVHSEGKAVVRGKGQDTSVAFARPHVVAKRDISLE